MQSKKMCAVIIVLLSGNLAFGQKSVHSIGLNIGFYKPSLEYWNHGVLSDWPSTFNGGLFWNMNAEKNLMSWLNIRLGSGNFSQSVSRDVVNYIEDGTVVHWPAKEKISLGIFTIEAAVLAFPFGSGGRMQPFVGAGSALSFVHLSFKRTPQGVLFSKQTNWGRDNALTVSSGSRFSVSEKLSLGIEFRAFLGDYIQLVRGLDGELTKQKVSLMGPQFMLSFNYLFGKDASSEPD